MSKFYEDQNTQDHFMFKFVTQWFLLPLLTATLSFSVSQIMFNQANREALNHHADHLAGIDKELTEEKTTRDLQDVNNRKITEERLNSERLTTDSRLSNMARALDTLIAQNTKVIEQNTEVITLIKIQNGIK